MTPDLINGLFEFLGGFLIWINVWRLHKDKHFAGVSIVPTAFFMVWGFWNLVFYQMIGQWWSFVGGVSLVVANCIWVWQMFCYRKNV